jgi:hypothetical protein
LNALNALRTGSQVTNPTFGSYAQQDTTQGADMVGAARSQFDAANSNYNNALGASNAANASNNNFTSGLFGLAGSALGGPMGGMIGKKIGLG